MSRKWSDYVTAVPNNNTPVIKVKDNVTRQSKSYVESSFVKRKLSSVTGCSNSKVLSAKVSVIMSFMTLNKSKLSEIIP